ncbi:hypothetical protein [Pseudonocardia ailaonensis]|uniref:hypothetical protein n=1 Tax=Pseudonocardia ailaonensis TaxID=367279 RepID=UPI0031DC90D8
MTLCLAVAFGALIAGELLAGRPAGVVAAAAAALVAAVRLRAPLPGPRIHDRELDLVIGAGAAFVAVALLVGQVVAPGRALGVLAVTPVVVAVLAVALGTRRLWHARGIPVVTALGWFLPWAGPLPIALASAGLVGVVALLSVRGRAVRLPGIRGAGVRGGTA